MNAVWAVIRREYLQRVRSRWFVLITLGAPLLVAGAVVLPAWLISEGEESSRNIVVVDETGVLAQGVVEPFREVGYEVEEREWSSGAMEALTAEVDRGDLSGFVVLDRATLTEGRARFYTRSRPSAIRRGAMRAAVTEAVVQATLAGGDVDVEALLQGADLRLELLSGDDGGRDEAELILGFGGSMALYLVILLWAAGVMRSTLEEKTTRIVEIVVSAMKPWQLMLGKIIGVGAVGLTQLLVWVVSLGVLLVLGFPALVAARPELAAIEGFRDVAPGPGITLLFVGYFLFGFFMYSGLYAAVGAMCNSEEEAQQVQMPVTMLIIIPMVFLPAMLDDPAGALARGLSLFPLFSPILMWPRIVAGAAPWWEVGLSFLGMAGAVFVVAWIAGRIYKVGMLMTGKRPTLPEIVRWVREA